MQNLSNAFDLKQHYAYLKKRLLTLLFVIFVPVLSHALVGSTICNDPAATQAARLGDQYLPGPTNLDIGVVPGLSSSIPGSMYHQLYIPADGNVTITFESLKNKEVVFEVGYSCGDTSFSGGSITVAGGTSFTIPATSVAKDSYLFFHIRNDNPNSQEYRIHINYDSPIILGGIYPTTTTFPQGMSKITLDVNLSRGAINGDLNVTYLRTDDNTTHSFVVDKWYDHYALVIDVNTSMNVGDEFNITLLSAIVDPATADGETCIIVKDYNTSTIHIGDPRPDLSVIKSDSVDKAKLGTTFYYNIAIANIGTYQASNVTVMDYMPSELVPYIDSFVAPGWNCGLVASTNNIRCDADHNLTVGANEVIQINIALPLPAAGGTALLTGEPLLNRAEAMSVPEDYDLRNNSDIELTTIVAEDYDEINKVEELCYLDTTVKTMLEKGYTQTQIDRNCKSVGNFYYSNGCEATVEIVADDNLTSDVENIQLIKMYAPQLVSSTGCYVDPSSEGTCVDNTFQNILVEESPSYHSGYIFNIGEISPDTNVTIGDNNSFDGNPNNPKDLDGIGIYATYKYEGVVHFGRLADCRGLSEGGVEITTYADAIDTDIGTDDALAAQYDGSLDTSSNGLKWIQTMVSSTPQRQIVGVHLNINTMQATKYLFSGDIKNYSDFQIIPYVVNSTPDGKYCSVEDQQILYDSTGAELVISIPQGAYSAPDLMAVPFEVRKDARLQLIYIDPNTLSPEGQKCLATSSTGGNLAGIGQCGNSEIQYVGGFGVDAWDRCAMSSGSPCLPQNGGYSNPAYPNYNPLYNNELGCYMCTFNIRPACSTDNFSIRPDKMDMNTTNPDAPHLLRAGKQYTISLTAFDALGNLQTDYTVTDHSYSTDLGTGVDKYFKNGLLDTNGILFGSPDINASVESYMVNGLSSATIDVPLSGAADELIKISYSDVGNVMYYVFDQMWAYVDHDDTPEDCTSDTHTYICAEKNVTFIPDHFEFAELNITNHAGPDNNFTYLANEKNKMSAKVQTRIRAMNAGNTVTRNFSVDASPTQQFYENNISVNLSVKVRALGNEDAGDNSYRYPDAKESNISNAIIGFGRAADVNGSGTRDILWNEPAYPLRFNFERDQKREENPFFMDGKYVSINVASKYTDPTNANEAIITGSRVGDENASGCASDPTCVQSNADGNATFLYGRTRASKFFYDDITDASVETPVALYVYCDVLEKGYVWCQDHLVDTVAGQTSIPNWWLSTKHNTSRGDGNITLQIGAVSEGTGNPTLLRDGGAENTELVVNVANGGLDSNISVIGNTVRRPMTVNIDLKFPTESDTAPWLIYNQSAAVGTVPEPPSPFFKVRFINTSGWTGVGRTGFVLDTNASSTKNKRLDW